MRKWTAFAALAGAVALVCSSGALADGSETLAPPPISLAAGTGIATGGTGTIFFQPGTINVNFTGTPKQALLYWAGHSTGFNGDNTVSVSINGGPTMPVTATGGLGLFPGAIGGPTRFFDFPGVGTYYSSYRADITALGGLHTGSNTITVSGLDFPTCGCYGNPPGTESGNDGAGVLVVYDNGSTPSTIAVRDGLDLAFQNFSSPLDTTVPQTFTYASAAADRGATLVNMVASVESTDPDTARPNVLRVSFDGGPATDYADEFTSVDGAQWDSIARSITIPAGSASMTVQVLSLNEDGTADLPASLGWVTSALSVTNLPPPPPPPGAKPLTPGYWKNHLAPVSATCRPNQGCSNNGPWTSLYLPQSLGNYSVDTTGKVTTVFDGMNCSSSSSQGAIGCLAGHLLATKLNLANGSSTCITGTVANADAFLKGQVVMGVTGISYTGPSGTYALTAAQRTLAISLKDKMDTYNNGGGC
jgi:hypothetical protein